MSDFGLPTGAPDEMPVDPTTGGSSSPLQSSPSIQIPAIVRVANYHPLNLQAAVDVVLKVGSTAPALDLVAYDALGVPIDFTQAASILFRMRTPGSAPDKVSGGNVTVLDAVNGALRYQWQATDIDTLGYYMADILVNWSDGTESVFPTADWIGIKVLGAA